MSEIASIRLVFADQGTFHAETIQVARETVDEYERLIDLIREEPAVTRSLYVDLKRLVSAHLMDED
jgi:hypothetical protein